MVMAQSYAEYAQASYPAEADVRQDTTYGDSFYSYTGTLDPGAGGTIPDADDVRLGIPVGVTTGNMVVPSDTEVVLGTAFDISSVGNVRVPPEGNVLLDYLYGPNDTLTGTLDPGAGGVIPSPNDVRLDVNVGLTTGLLDLPSVDDTRLAVSFDQGTKVGNVRVPPTNKVEEGYQYDSNDGLTGTLIPAIGEMPDVENVRFGIGFGDSMVGVLLLPAEPQVLLDVGFGAYGTEFYGSLRDVPGGVGSEAPPVTIEGNLRSPLIIGDDYIAAKGRAFQWTLSLWSGFDPGSATAVFRGRDVCSSEGYEWEVTGTVAADGDGYIATFEIPTAVSELITAGNYDWWVVIDDVTVQSSESFGSVEWALG